MINQESEGAAWGKMGTLDSMQIGDITFRNSLIAVAPPNKLDSIMMVDAVLGMDFICMFWMSLLLDFIYMIFKN